MAYTFQAYKFKGKKPKTSPLSPTLPDFQQPTVAPQLMGAEEKDPTITALEVQKKNLEQRLEQAGVQEGADRNLAQKALNLDANQGLLSGLFEVLDRPGQTVKGAIIAAREGENVLKGAFEGLTGQSEIRGHEFAKEVLGLEIDNMTGVGKMLTGLAVDIASDPLTFVSGTAMMSAIMPNLKVTKTATQMSGAIDDVAKALAGEMPQYQKFLDLDITKLPAEEVATLKTSSEYIDFQRNIHLRLKDQGILFVPQEAVDRNLLEAERLKGTGWRERAVEAINTKARKAKASGGVIKGEKGFYLTEELKINERVIDLGAKKNMTAGADAEYITANAAANYLDGLLKTDDPVAYELLKDAKVYLGDAGGQDKTAQLAFELGFDAKRPKEYMLKDFDIRVPTKYGGEVTLAKVEVKKAYVGGDWQSRTFSFKQNKKGEIIISRDLSTTVGEVHYKKLSDAFLNSDLKGVWSNEYATLLKDGGKLTHGDLLKMEDLIRQKMAAKTSDIDILNKAFDAEGIPRKAGGKSAKNARQAIRNRLTKEGKLSGLGSVLHPSGGKAELEDLYELIKEAYRFDKNGFGDLKHVQFVDRQGNLLVMRADDIFDPVFQSGIRMQAGVSADDISRSVRSQVNYKITERPATLKKFKKMLSDNKQVQTEWMGEVFEKGQKALGEINVSKTLEVGAKAPTRKSRVKTALVTASVVLLDKLPKPWVDAGAQTVNATKQTFQSMGFSLNANKGLSREFVDQVNGISGKAGTRLQRAGARLSDLTKYISTKNPGMKPDDILNRVNKIMESGVQVDELGNISYADNIWTLEELGTSLQGQIKAGQQYLVLGVANEAQAKNMVDKLHHLMGTSDELFRPVVKNGTATIEVVGDHRDVLDEFRLLLDPNNWKGDEAFNLGKVQLDEATEKFYLENRKIIDNYGGIRDEMVDILVQEVGHKNLPDFLKGRFGYMRHTLAPEAAKGIEGLQQASRSRYFREGVDLLGQRAYIGSADQINNIMRDFYDMPVDMFDVNAHSSLESLMRVTMENVEQKQMVDVILKGKDSAGESFFTLIDNTKDAAKRLPPKHKVLTDSLDAEFSKMFKNLSPESQEAVTKAFADMGFDPKTQKIAMHKSAYGHLERLNKAYIDLPPLVRGYDKFLNVWKSVTLVSPGFHMRNLFGNMTNMYLVGMSPAAQMNYMGKMQMAMGDYRKVIDLMSEGKTLEQITKLHPDAIDNFKSVLSFYESGVAQTHKGVRDLDSVKLWLEKGGKQTLSKKIVETNFNIAENMDDFQRLALYQWSYDKGLKQFSNFPAKQAEMMARSHASDVVRNSLFDYSNLTSMERSYMKRIFPFYTFMKNNLVFQMKNIVKNPAQYAKLGRAYNYSVEELGGIAPEEMPDYMQDNMWLPIPWKVKKDDKKALAFLKLNLPVADFTEFVENPLKKGATSVTAPMKLFWELGTGTDSFTGAKIREFPGEQRRMSIQEGVLTGIRDDKGNFSLSGNPIMQKIGNDIGFRVPKNYAGLIFDAMDTAVGRQSFGEFGGEAAARLGLVGIQTEDKMELTKLYQDLERLRRLQKLYEQEMGQKLPTLN